MNKVFFAFWCSLSPFLISTALAASAQVGAPTVAPDLKLTPGVLCTPTDPDFKGLDYPEKIARCNRNIPIDEKVKVAAAYGNIPQSEWSKYEFDHLLPLCAGGSDDPRNLWPQPIDQAHEKDKLEVQICTAMKAGTMTQAEAVQKVYAWFSGASTAVQAPPTVPTQPSTDLQSVTCNGSQSSALVGRFRVIDDKHLDGISLSLNDNGDHEIISASGSTSGVISRAKTSPLAGLLRFTILSADRKDRFDLYIPANPSSVRQQSFSAYVKISFEGTYPNLEQLSCSYDSAK